MTLFQNINLQLLKTIGLILGLLLVTLPSRADTISFWHVSLNGEVIAKINELQPHQEIKLSKDALHPEDSIVVDFFRDTPCSDCQTILTVEDLNQQVVASWVGKGTFSLKKISVGSLLISGRSDFYIRYRESRNRSRNEEIPLFKIKLE